MTMLAARPTQQFTESGYAHLPGWLTGDALTAVRALAAALATDAPGVESCKRPNNTLVPLRWNDRLVAQMVADPEALRRLSAIVDARDLRWVSGYLSIKEPNSPPLWWHQDWWCWNHPVSYRRAPSQVSLLCYLIDTTVSSGALRLIPGSHARSIELHAALPEAHADDTSLLPADHPAMSDHPEQATLSVRAGDAVVTDYRLLHGTHANSTGVRRDCVLLNFAPNWSELPDDVRGHLISHSALPGAGEVSPSEPIASLLPTYEGPRADLPLSRNAPADFGLTRN